MSGGLPRLSQLPRLAGVMVGTEIEPLDNEEYEVQQYFEHRWWYIKDSELHWIHCTANQRFYDGEGYPKQAQDFEAGDIIRHRTGDFEVTESGGRYRDAAKLIVQMKRIHLYWANGFLSHT